MNKNRICVNWALLVVPCATTAFAAADSTDTPLSRALMQDASERSSFLTDSPPVITLGGQLQFRYQANFRDSAGLVPSDNDTTIGFVMRRAKIFGKAVITDDITGHFQFAFSRSSGKAALEVGEIEWKLNDDFKLLLGQFKSPLLREELVSSKRQLVSERSAVNESFNQDYSQGVELAYAQDKWRGAVMVSDGFNTDNTPFNSAKEADFAITGRVEFLFGKALFKQFK